MNAKPRVLILCTGNSCRSHMAEGILRAAAGDEEGGRSLQHRVGRGAHLAGVGAAATSQKAARLGWPTIPRKKKKMEK